MRILGDPLGDLQGLYDRHGLAGIGEVPGEWALVVPDDDGLIVATDAFGGLPLFVRGVEVSSGQPAADWMTGPIDPVEVRQHVEGRFPEPWRTFIQGVWRVPAGHGGRLGRPQDLRPIFCPRGSTVPLAEAVTAAVDDRVRGPVTLALSGGLDSSVLAIVLAGRDVLAASNRFSGRYADEGVYIEAMRAAVPSGHLDLESAGLDPFEVLDRLVAPGLPPVLANHHLNLALMGLGRDLVTGFGGDEVFGHGFDVVRRAASQGDTVRALWEAAWLTLRYRHDRTLRPTRWFEEAWKGRRQAVADPRRRRLDRVCTPLLARSREEQRRLAEQQGVRLLQPLLDPRILSAVLEVLPEAAVTRGRTRMHVREAFHDRLPPLIRDRSDKADISVSIEALSTLRGTRAPHVEALVPGSTQVLEGPLRTGNDLCAAWRITGAERFLSWHARHA